MILAQQHTFWGRDNNQKKKKKKSVTPSKQALPYLFPDGFQLKKKKKTVKVINL